MASATNFKEYMYGLGGEVCHDFLVTIGEVWGIKPEEMLPDWAPKELEYVNNKHPFSDQYCGISAKGTGHLMDILKEEIHQHGGVVFTGKIVNALETDQNNITKIKFEDTDEVLVENDEYIINTIPQSVLSRFLGFESRLDFRGIISTYISYSGIKRIIPEPYN